MSWIDLLRMSSGNLRRRKLRTLLTVLGVVIGTASIVVMISLGLGLQQSIYAEVEQMGGITNIQVSGASGGGSMMMHMDDESDQHITDAALQDFGNLEYVTSAEPVLSIPIVVLKGKYISHAELMGLAAAELTSDNMKLEDGGKYPTERTQKLEMIFGNWAPEMFYDEKTGKGYWETGEFPDINYDKDQFQVILDQDAYWERQDNQGAFNQEAEEGSGARIVKKQIAQGVGLVAGGVNAYNNYSYGVYCNIETLKEILKKEFAGRAIPGQPLKENGKPYKELIYSYANVKVDSIDNVEQVSQVLREMGYGVQSNIEYLNSMKSQFAIIQMVLGGIGAISLLVAAIGITNTMMMSIYERTKEIGVLKVLGCDMKNIKQLFLMEAAGIGLLGGIAGNVLSFMLSKVMNLIAASSGAEMGITQGISYIPWWLAFGAMGIAISVGMVAGYFPARRAMKLSPLEAIRTN